MFHGCEAIWMPVTAVILRRSSGAHVARGHPALPAVELQDLAQRISTADGVTLAEARAQINEFWSTPLPTALAPEEEK